MAVSLAVQLALEELVRDLDLIVFRLERDVSDPDSMARERPVVRRELEDARDRLERLVRDL